MPLPMPSGSHATTLLFHDPPAALAASDALARLEAAVIGELRGQDLGVVRVRFVPGEGGPPPRYLCQIYSGPIGVFLSEPDWVWWSSAFERPNELAAELKAALRLHREGAPRHRASAPWPSA